jgi:hypothetical protein
LAISVLCIAYQILRSFLGKSPEFANSFSVSEREQKWTIFAQILAHGRDGLQVMPLRGVFVRWPSPNCAAGRFDAVYKNLWKNAGGSASDSLLFGAWRGLDFGAATLDGLSTSRNILVAL